MGAELLHPCNDQGLHEEGGVCEPAPGRPSGQLDSELEIKAYYAGQLLQVTNEKIWKT